MASQSNSAASPATDNFKAEEVILIRHIKDEYTVATLQETLDNKQQPFTFKITTHKTIDKDLLNQHLIDQVPAHLANLNILISTKSGTELADKFATSVLQPLLHLLDYKEGTTHAKQSHDEAQESSNRYKITHTKDANSVADFGRQIFSQTSTPESRTFVILSGDGGVADLINSVPAGHDDAIPSERRPTIALLPFGTGNALFHSLHKHEYKESGGPSPYVVGLRTLLRGKAQALPTFRVEFPTGSELVNPTTPAPASFTSSSTSSNEASPSLLGAVVASYGFHAQLVYESDTPEYRVHGAGRFGMVAENLLKDTHAYHAELDVTFNDGRSATVNYADGERFNYALFTTVSNLEKTFTISPDSKPLDGKLRMVYFANADGKQTMAIMNAAYAGGKHVGMKWKSSVAAGETDGGEMEERETEVWYHEVVSAELKITEKDERWRKVCVDGSIVTVPEGGKVKIVTEDVLQPFNILY